MATTDAPPIVTIDGISKYFPGVIANEAVSLDVRAGEIHALLGENGAGKSTLMNVLTGIYQADAGRILIDGRPVAFASPVDAIAAGIGMVHQHFKLVQAFTVAENVHLGWSETPFRASKAALEARTAALAERFNLAVRPAARVSELSAGEQQRVEILKVLARAARVLILDEPTAVLTPGEARELFKALRAFKAAGNAVIFISHKLDEVLEISDRVTILRGGRKVATHPATDCTPKSLAQEMVGKEIVLGNYRETAVARPGPPRAVVSLRGITVRGERGIDTLSAVDLDVHAGEILGIAGVAGNGQQELSEVLTGVIRPHSGEILLNGVAFSGSGPRDFVEVGIGHIPQDRLKTGLAPGLSITENAVFREYRDSPVAKGALFRPAAALELATRIARDANVSIPSFLMPVRNLSGGNQQRLVARREMRIAETMLVAAYPSRGLDVGAIDTMLTYLMDLRNKGVAVVLISEELEELFNLSDRIAVLYEGRIQGVFTAADADLETVGLMMGGKTRTEAA